MTLYRSDRDKPSLKKALPLLGVPTAKIPALDPPKPAVEKAVRAPKPRASEKVRPDPAQEAVKAATAVLFERHRNEHVGLAEGLKRDSFAKEHEVRKALQKSWDRMNTAQAATVKELGLANGAGAFGRAVFISRHRPLLEQVTQLRPREVLTLSMSERSLTRLVERAHYHQQSQMQAYTDGCVSTALDKVRDEYRGSGRVMVERQQAERDVLLARSTAKPVAEKAPERGPDMQQGESMAPADVKKLLIDPRPLSEVFFEKAGMTLSPKTPPKTRDPNRAVFKRARDKGSENEL